MSVRVFRASTSRHSAGPQTPHPALTRSLRGLHCPSSHPTPITTLYTLSNAYDPFCTPSTSCLFF